MEKHSTEDLGYKGNPDTEQDDIDVSILPEVKELSQEQELLLEKNIVWLFGVRRSGTTWLGKQLLSYNTRYLHEPDITDHLAVSMHRGENVTRRIDTRGRYKSYFFSTKYKKTWSPYLRKLLLYRIYAQAQTLTHKIIVKEPTSDFAASDILVECMPNSKIIVLLRDGRDIIDSLLDARQEGGWNAKRVGGMPEQKRMRMIGKKAELWVQQMDILVKTYESEPKNMKLMLRYEDLLSNTFEIMKKLYQFLDIQISDDKLKSIIEEYKFENIPAELKGSGKFYRAASPGKWKENLSQEEQELVEAKMANMLVALGYKLEVKVKDK